jgi:DNA polymerase I-like protein with 3'-5' exonuclease and polymerase domains
MQHGLAAWGKELGYPKVEHEDWSTLTQEMIHRCEVDVEITDRVDDALVKEAGDWDWSLAEKIENRFRYILSEQEAYGVMLDVPKVEYYIEQLEAKVYKTDKEVLPMLPLKVITYEKVTKALRKDGMVTRTALNWFGSEALESNIEGDFCKAEFREIDLGSSKQVKDYLLAAGWEPQNWNWKGRGKGAIRMSPKMKDSQGELDPFIGLTGKAPKLLASRAQYMHKINSDSFFGKEMRSCFTVPDDKIMVGADLSALEQRVAAHYTIPLDGGVYSKRILEGDVHQYVADNMGIDRPRAKTISYGIMYGAGVGKVAAILQCEMPEAYIKLEEWWNSNPSLKELKQVIERALTEHPGWIRGIDGRKIQVRSPHSAMNALFQCAGSIINKLATIFIYKKMKSENIDGHLVINMHDEQNCELNKLDVDKYTEIVHTSYTEAGEYLKLNVPIVGEVKIGRSWNETH